jgi:hypothetical protein
MGSILQSTSGTFAQALQEKQGKSKAGIIDLILRQIKARTHSNALSNVCLNYSIHKEDRFAERQCWFLL